MPNPHTPAPEPTVLLSILERLVTERSDAADTSDSLASSVFPPGISRLTKGDLDRLRPGIRGGTVSVDLVGYRKYIILPPVDKGTKATPVFFYRREVTPSHTQYCYRVFLLMQTGAETQAIGLRFEGPEQGQDGQPSRDHSMYHVQFARGYCPSQPLRCVPGWLPDEQPAFPLLADDSVTLLLAALVSLYGQSVLDRDDLVRVLKGSPYEAKAKALRGPRPACRRAAVRC